MDSILKACLVMGLLALVFGVILTVANKIFAVYKDPKVDAVREVLPGANCGGCGKAGCDAMAESIVKGESPVNACPVGGAPVAAKVAAVLGQEAGDYVKKVCFVRCHASQEECQHKYDYYGVKDCVEAAAVMGGAKSCPNGCLGYGTCVKVCQFGAIHINEKGIAEIDPEKCTGCMACMKVCPRHVISITLYDKHVHVTCSNTAKGKAVKLNCKVGCITCGICEKNCPFGAITINKEKNLPEIDYTKCRECLVCVEKCPQGCMTASVERKHAVIDQDKCIKCGLCRKACPKEAIEGATKEQHTVITDKCIGCGLCTEACKKDAIHLF